MAPHQRLPRPTQLLGQYTTGRGFVSSPSRERLATQIQMCGPRRREGRPEGLQPQNARAGGDMRSGQRVVSVGILSFPRGGKLRKARELAVRPSPDARPCTTIPLFSGRPKEIESSKEHRSTAADGQAPVYYAFIKH